MSKFQVAAGPYQGPLDLLLYLIRQHELDVLEVPLAPLAEQCAQSMMEQGTWDVAAAADFLDVVGLLVEMKSERLIPNSEEQLDEAALDQRENLVRRLLEYKRYREVAADLELRRQQWQDRQPRDVLDDKPQTDEELTDLEIWDLVTAYSRLMREHVPPPETSLVRDETPIQSYMDQVRRCMGATGRSTLRELLPPGSARAALVGLFLAILELVRSGEVRAEQTAPFGEIWLTSTESLERGEGR